MLYGERTEGGGFLSVPLDDWNHRSRRCPTGSHECAEAREEGGGRSAAACPALVFDAEGRGGGNAAVALRKIICSPPGAPLLTGEEGFLWPLGIRDKSLLSLHGQADLSARGVLRGGSPFLPAPNFFRYLQKRARCLCPAVLPQDGWRNALLHGGGDVPSPYPISRQEGNSPLKPSHSTPF